MNFDIPMNTKQVMGTDSLMGLMGGSTTPTPQPSQAVPTQQPQMGMPNNNYGGNVGMNMQPQQPQMGVQSNNVGMNMQPQQQMQQPMTPRQRPSGNGVHLKKGQKVNLAQQGQTLTNIKVCLGWDIMNMACDLDASAFMLDANNKVIGDDWFVFYGQTTSPDGSVTHSGDSQGEGIGDDEIISINLPRVNPNVKKLVFVVTIDEALEKGLNFSMVQNAYVRVVDSNTNQELIKFTLTDYYANVTSMVVGEVYNHNGQWKFNAVGDGVAKDLAGLCAMYGVNVAD